MNDSKKNTPNYYLNSYKKNHNTIKNKKIEINKNQLNKNNLIKLNNKSKTTFDHTQIADNQNINQLDNKRLSALLLIFLNLNDAVKVIKHLPEKELIILINEIEKINHITPQDIALAEKTLGKINKDNIKNFSNGQKFVITLLNSAFNQNEARLFFIKCHTSSQNKNINKYDEFNKDDKNEISLLLNDLSASQISELINKETNTIKATVLSFLNPQKTAEVLQILPKNIIGDLLKKISQKIKLNQSTIDIITNKLKQKISSLPSSNYTSEGKTKLLEILKRTSLEHSLSILENLEKTSPELALELTQKIFVFEDLKSIPSKSLEKVLKNYEDKEIAFILKGASQELKNTFLSCVTKKRKILIEDEINYLGKVKKREVDEKRKDFLNYIKQLEKESKITLKSDHEIYIK